MHSAKYEWKLGRIVVLLKRRREWTGGRVDGWDRAWVQVPEILGAAACLQLLARISVRRCWKEVAAWA